MANEALIINGSFKGIPIAIDSGSLEGGRKVAVKQFPNRDTQSAEDLGLIPRKYSLEIIISDKQERDYFGYRNSLLAALESEGHGDLIHPFYGRISNVVAVSFSLNESFGSFGDATISVSFEIDDSTGIPKSSGNVITQISAANDLVQSAVNGNIANAFSVTEKFTGNFKAAVDKVESILERTRSATSFIGEASDSLNEFSALISGLSASVNSIVSDPLALAQAGTVLFESVNGIYSSADATFDTFLGFFGFGDNDIPERQTTAGRIERQANNEVLNGAVSGSSLGYAYLAMSRIDFKTTREIDDLSAELDGQYLSVQAGGSSQEVKDSITEMRVQVIELLDQARVNASQIITIQTNPTTARLLAFSYYGDDNQGESIVALNNISDVSFVDGSVQVVTA